MATKVPTVLAYHNNDTRWGYQVNDLEESVRGFKLLLDKSKDIKFRPAIESEILIQKMSQPPVRFAGEYLNKIVSHAKSILGRRVLGKSMNSMDIHYIVTVPAVWSDKAKDLTMQAATLADMPQNNLYLLSEPEAAAVYTIRAIQPNSIAKGDTFIVCDAGGGTVDLITYRITQTEPVRMEEIVEGAGEVCGSVLLDDAFEAYLSDTIGKKIYDALSDDNKRHALRRWQVDIKPSYSGPDADGFLNAGYAVPVPGAPDTQDGRAILLVGGLGASEYLYTRLKDRFSELEIMQPRDAWSAVVRGAVHRGLQGNQVLNRKARCDYGIEFCRNFDEERDQGKTPVWCSWEEKWMIDNNMRWYIKKGDSFSEGQPVIFSFYRNIPKDSSFIFHETLYACVNGEAPLFKNDDVSEHCDLTVDLSKVPKELFDYKTNSHGKGYYRVDFEIILIPQSACLIFEFQMNSISYGTVRARYY
ncbi:hypothetical protein PENSTE_c025G09627 [Penicillium steckii]|uniref:Actin-like ATPase domain-containing protein n=1 Tax=Penicillium steckii TaxID=303698 RepID=A0A1V6SQ62_9EURO|nr:hypothetical protein PENSTE_c025G09627 [Penicillium steckii]